MEEDKLERTVEHIVKTFFFNDLKQIFTSFAKSHTVGRTSIWYTADFTKHEEVCNYII